MIPRRADFRDASRYAAAVATELAAPLLRTGAHILVRGRATSPHEWRSGVILGNGHIGDVLYRTCSLEHLTHALPGCRWSFLTTAFAAEVLANNPYISEALPLCQSASASSIDSEDRDRLRARHFDVALCTEYTRSYEGLLLALRLGIPNRVAIVNKGLSALATLPVRLQAPMARPAQIRTMIEALTGEMDDSPLIPSVYPSQSDREHATREWERLGVAGAPCVIACALGTRQGTGSLPPEFFHGILQRVIELRPDTRVIFIGSSEESPKLLAESERLAGAAVVSSGVLGLRAMVAMLERCSGFLGTDSGPRHLANAARIPVFFARNMVGSEAETSPYSPDERDIAPHGEYLSPDEIIRALAGVDRDAVARMICAAAYHHTRDSAR